MPHRAPPKSARSSRIIRFRSIRHRVFSRHIFLNPHLAQLRPYPFERLRALFASVVPNPQKPPISLSIGEPRHPTPRLLLDALAAGARSEEHTSELQSQSNLVCRLLLEKKKHHPETGEVSELAAGSCG